MRFILTGIRTTLARRLRQFRGWLPLLLIPMLVLAVRSALPSTEMTAPVQVGVALPQSGGEKFRQLLEARSGTVVTFMFCDRDTIDRNVAAGIWDCGLVLPEDFASRVEVLDLKRLVTIRTGPGSVVYPLVRETVSACLAQLVSPEIAWDYLVGKGLVDPDGDVSAARERLAQALGESDRVLVTMSTVDGAPLALLQLADAGISAALYWLVSVLMLVWLLLSATQTGGWFRGPGALRLSPLQPATARLLTQIGADGLLAIASGILTMVLLGAKVTAWASVAAYGLFWTGAALLLSRVRGVGNLLPVVLPFAAVISLLLGGTLADPSLFLPELAPVLSRLPVRLFLRGCGGEGKAVAGLVIWAAVLPGVSVFLDRLQKNK